MIEVRSNPARSRYEIVVDDEVAGHVRYRREDGWLVLEHTVVEERFSGQSLGSRLAGGTFSLLRAEPGTVAVECPFLKRWLAKHPEFDDVVA